MITCKRCGKEGHSAGQCRLPETVPPLAGVSISLAPAEPTHLKGGTAPRGQCPWCDRRRTDNAAHMKAKRHAAKQADT